MRSFVLALAALASALALGACGGGPCQDLGERLCSCAPAGVTKESCVQGVKKEVKDLDPSGDEDAACSRALRTCRARKNPDTGEEMSFCDWISGRCGKSSCGISAERYADLSGYQTDAAGNLVLDEGGNPIPITPDPDDPTQALCPK